MVDPPDLHSVSQHHIVPQETRNDSTICTPLNQPQKNIRHSHCTAASHLQCKAIFSRSVIALILTLFLVLTTTSASYSTQQDATQQLSRVLHVPNESSPKYHVAHALRNEAQASLEDGAPVKSSKQAHIFQSSPVARDHFQGNGPSSVWHVRVKRQEASCSNEAKGTSTGEKIGFGILVPILVILSGIFAGLTLGYMSLDETQLHVLLTTGDDVQRARAKKIIPIREDGHLLLTTLLIANMITNEVRNWMTLSF